MTNAVIAIILLFSQFHLGNSLSCLWFPISYVPNAGGKLIGIVRLEEIGVNFVPAEVFVLKYLYKTDKMILINYAN